MAMNNRTGSGADKMSRAPQKKPENTWNTIRRLTGYMKKSIPLIIVTFLIIIAGTVMQVLSPKLLGSATTPDISWHHTGNRRRLPRAGSDSLYRRSAVCRSVRHFLPAAVYHDSNFTENHTCHAK